MSRQTSRLVLILPLLLLAFSSGLGAIEPPRSPGVAQLLSAAKDQASDLNNDIATLDFFAASESGWKTHAAITALYADRIAGLRNLAARLAAVRPSASPLEQATIDRIVPLLQGFASCAEAEINTLNANQSRLATGEYKDYLKVNATLAGEFSDLIGSSVNFGKTMAELAGAAQKTGAPAGPF